jgi:signal recognition particle GTPase
VLVVDAMIGQEAVNIAKGFAIQSPHWHADQNGW